ncbi:MAG: hypothetical protein IT244_12275 [Bacteroidia bacterium]|nr:hypothetical protein [Bacteroidota bacterium]MCC7299102.1 hypothetical protein [Bacteroidia bacterium]
MSDLENLNQLSKEDATPEVLLKTKEQIEKDLGLCGFQYAEVDQPTALPELVPELSEKIEFLKNSGSSDLMKIVYRVDLTEKQYKKVGLMPGLWHENLAKAIVLRAFQKVIIRKKFSN